MKNYFLKFLMITTLLASSQVFSQAEIGIMGDIGLDNLKNQNLGTAAVGMSLTLVEKKIPVYTKFDVMGKLGEKATTSSGVEIPSPLLAVSTGLNIGNNSDINLKLGAKGALGGDNSAFMYGPEVIAGVRFAGNLKWNTGVFYDVATNQLRVNAGISASVKKQ
jgi:hypothetical protein